MKFIKPMLCKLGTKDDLYLKNYIYEPKLDGYRILFYYTAGKVKIYSRNGHDVTHKFPELIDVSFIKAKSCILDGEVVVYGKDGFSNFQKLQGRTQLEDKNLIKKESQKNPVSYVVFDILMLDGKSILDYPIERRKELLKKSLKIKKGSLVKVIKDYKTPKRLWPLVEKKEMEGVVAKKKESLYFPDKRDRTWIKIKLEDAADCVIIGFVQGKRKISALLLGMYNSSKKIQYVGKVGTGFNAKNIKELLSKFKPLMRIKPVLNDTGEKDVNWLRPKLVGEIKYLEWTKDKKLRHPAFLRLRDDKDATDCKI